jgi:hypothetical protein
MHRRLRTARPQALTSRGGGHNDDRAMCGWCWGQRAIFEASPFGLMPVVCGRCDGHGHEATSHRRDR